jgi:hypothetical protein
MSNSKEYEDFAMKNPVILVGQPVPHSTDSSYIAKLWNCTRFAAFWIWIPRTRHNSTTMS